MTGEELIPAEVRFLAVASLAALLGWVLHLVRSQRLGLRDSLLWIISTGSALVLVLFPRSLWALARGLGVQVPANALFALAILYVLVNILSGTLTASRNAERTRRLAQECAALRAELQLVRRELRGKGEG